MEINRNQLREIFQPSRVVFAIVEDTINKRENFLPIAFNMYCGYYPLSFAFAIHDINYSYGLFEHCDEFSIAIPGESLANIAIESGSISGDRIDKFQVFNLNKFYINDFKICGISECIINIFCEKVFFKKVSDHAIIVGKIKKIIRDPNNHEKCLLSISSDLEGFKLLASKGIHRIAVKGEKNVD